MQSNLRSLPHMMDYVSLHIQLFVLPGCGCRVTPGPFAIQWTVYVYTSNTMNCIRLHMQLHKHYLDIFSHISQEDLALNETVIQPAFTELKLLLPRDECLIDVCENLFATCLYVT